MTDLTTDALCASGGVAEMTDTRELVERLKVVARCGTDSTMRHSAYAFMTQDPEGDYVTYSAYATLSERNRRLSAVVEEIASRQTLSGHDGDLDWLIDDARAALTSGGRG